MVDLRSDTVTRPTPGMRRAMAEAVVGDDVFGDDPTVTALEARCAELAGKEAALFVPSGTMANLLAIKLATQVGDEVLLHQDSHPYNYEAGGSAAFAGVQLKPLPGERGLLDPATVARALRPPDPHFAPAKLLCVEDTANRGGGTVYPLATLDALAALAARHSLATHLDGARVMHAVVASGTPLARRLEGWTTACFCFSKGLGAPVGSILVGPTEVIQGPGRRFRKLLGGGLRQSGILAAAALYALDHHVDRLADDHARARALAEGLVDRGFAVRPPETNLLYVTVDDARRAQVQLAERGIACLAVSATELRLVLHLDVAEDDLPKVLDAFAALGSEA